MIDSTYLSKKLSALGIQRGDVLIIHSAFAAVGEVEGGTDAMLDALLGAIGEEGTLIFPTFTDVDVPFSVENSKSTTGILGEVLRKRKGAIRSRHPSHSVVAFGRQAAEFAGDEWITESTVGKGTVYERLVTENAKMMLLGVDLDRCTVLHHFEDAFGLDYLVPIRIAPPVERPDITVLHRFPNGHRMFMYSMETVRDKPWFTIGYIGDARTLIFPTREMYKHCAQQVEFDKYMFLCDNESCGSCMQSRGKTLEPAIVMHPCKHPTCEVCHFKMKLD